MSNYIGVELAVAFNPYFPKEKDRVTEIQRLNKKLSTGIRLIFVCIY